MALSIQYLTGLPVPWGSETVGISGPCAAILLAGVLW